MSEQDSDIHAGGINLSALRHAVYRELSLLLPPASVEQTMHFIANLALCRDAYSKAENLDQRDQAVRKIVARFRNLRVSPESATATKYKKLSQSEIEHALERKFGDALAEVPGFYLTGRWRLNLPEGCVLYAYRSSLGFINGFLCQPLHLTDRYFLLSSSRYDGFKAVRLRPNDQLFFQGFKEPAACRVPRPECSPDLPGFRWTGRRFIERNH